MLEISSILEDLTPSTSEDESPPSSNYPWIVLLVAVPDALVDECVAAASPIPVVRAPDPRTAAERVLSLRPIVVLVGSDVALEELNAIRGRVAATRASLLLVDPVEETDRTLADRIAAAVADAEVRRAAARARR